MATTLSRRGFSRLLATGVGLAAARTARRAALESFAGGAVAPAPRAVAAVAAAGPIRLSSNENPYGPSPAALEAIRGALPLSGRYPDEPAEQLAAELGRHHGLSTAHVLLGCGSSEVLKLAVAAAAGRGLPLVMAEPTFEAVAVYARNAGVEVVKVPLTADHRHDLPRMLAAARGGGLVYICNPNNPTASVTPAVELRAFLEAVPPATLVLVDEAYHHFARGGGYETMVPLVGARPNLVIARTFSKVYGMAGLRCGYGVAQPELLSKLHAQQAWDSLNLPGLVAATASLGDVEHVEASRRRNLEVREECCDALTSRGLRVIPSQANFFMVDLGRPVGPVIARLRERGVEVGRLFAALPTHLRVTVGTRSEMQAFLGALERVMASAAEAS